jgi:hypothetical protein
MKGKKLSAKERLARLEESKMERARVFKELLAHLGQGYSIECFTLMSPETIRSYLKRFPEEFCDHELQDAIRKGRGYWEGLGRRQSDGTCIGNSRTWYYNMANRYGWRDKLDIEAEHKGTVSVNVVSYASKKASSDT